MAPPHRRNPEIFPGDAPPTRKRPLVSRKETGEPVPRPFLEMLYQVQAALGRAFTAAAPGIHAPDLNLAIHEVITGALLARVLCGRGFLAELPPGSGPDDFLDFLARAGEVVSLPVTGTSLSLPEVPVGRTPLPHLLAGDGYAALSPLLDIPALQFAEVSPEGWAGTLSALLARRVYLTDGYRAEVMERQAVRSAGGYTPVEPFLAGYLVRAGLAQLSAGDFGLPRVLDPCCGGGALLLAAFRALSPWVPAGLPVERASQLQETLTGIDSDPRAVLSTRFILLLAMIEEAEPSTLPQPGWHSLTRTIQWGNALVEPEPYKRIRTSALDGDEAYLVCPLAWEEIVSQTPAGRGFDLVLVNPPSGGLPRHPPLREYFAMQYMTAHEADDPTPLFIERSLALLRPAGALAAITDRGWLRSAWGEPLRTLLSRAGLVEVTEILPKPGGAVPGTGLLILVAKNTSPLPEIRTARITDPGIEDLSAAIQEAVRLLPSGSFGAGGWSFADRRTPQLAAAIRTGSRPLSEVLMGRITEATADEPFLPGLKKADEKRTVTPGDITPFRVGRQYIPPERGVSSLAGQRIFLAAPAGKIVAGLALPDMQPGPGVIVIGSRDPFLLAVLNSPIVTFCHRNLPRGSGGGLPPLTVRAAGRIPVPPVDFDDPGAAISHSRASRVAFMLATGEPPADSSIRDGIRAVMQDLARLYGLREDDLTLIGDG